ncbi:MAG: tetratricopeptide repeat protein [Polyangiaceae bacterium]|nr:tetratricopeptide repeat protein [Polyangiaceae bacterium]
MASKSDLYTRARTVPFGFVYKVLPLTSTPKTVVPDILSSPVLGERPPLFGADDLVRGLVSDYYLMLGEAHAERGDRKLAVARYADAVRVHSASKETVNNVASTCAEREYYTEAEQWMRQAAALSPSYVTPRRNLAKLLDSQGKRDEAIAAFEELIKVTPEDTAAKARLAQLKSLPPGSKPKPVQPSSPPGVDPRISDLQKAISETPDNPALRNNLGNVYAESGDAQSAILAYEAALQVDPKYALAHKNLGLLYRDVLKDNELAEKHFSLYKSLGGR